MIDFMRVAVRKIGNSRGIIIPRPLLDQVGLLSEADMSVQDDAIVIRKPSRKVREGWAQASRTLAAAGHDAPAWPEFSNTGDEELVW